MIEIKVAEDTASDDVRVLNELTKSATIFERLDNLESDVDDIKVDVAEVMEALETMNKDFVSAKTESINNKDLNDLFGRVIIAYGNSCLNRPSGLNGYLINIPHDTRPTVYNKQIWITRPANNVYVRNMDGGTWGDWIPLHYDTGWQNLTLASGISVFNANRPVQYRRINNTVYVRGGIKGVKANGTVIATLPSGYRPQYAFYFVQNTSNQDNYAIVARFQIKTTGEIVMQYDSGSFEDETGSNWYNLECSFLID